MTEDQIAANARALAIAEATRVPIEPLTDAHPDMTVGDAYQIQLLNTREKTLRGQHVRGHKVGLTAAAMRQMFGVDEPDYGHLTADMFVFEGSEVAISRYISPRIEIEPAFILARPLEGPGVTVADVMRATDFVVPSLEIIDSRVKDWRIRLQDTIADNGSSAGVVLAGRPRRLTSIDAGALAATLRIDGEGEQTGNTGDILGNPVNAVAWLANALAEFDVRMEAGQVILPGACTKALTVQAGSVVLGELEGLGTVSVAFC